MRLLLDERGHEIHITPEVIKAASVNGHLEVVKLLLKKGADVTVASNDGWTPLIAASASGHLDIVRLPVLDGINPDASDDGMRTALSWAAGKGHQLVVEYLLADERVNKESSDSNGETPLTWALRKSHKGVVQRLLYHEAYNKRCSSDWLFFQAALFMSNKELEAVTLSDSANEDDLFGLKGLFEAQNTRQAE